MSTKVVSFRVGTRAYAKLLLEAERKGLDLSDYILTRVYHSPEQITDIKTVSSEKGAVVSNPEANKVKEERLKLKNNEEKFIKLINDFACILEEMIPITQESIDQQSIEENKRDFDIFLKVYKSFRKGVEKLLAEINNNNTILNPSDGVAIPTEEKKSTENII